METLKSKEAAQRFLRCCLQGIPASWWADFNGRGILEILYEIHRDSKIEEGRRQGRLVVRLMCQLYRRARPDRERILAAWLVCGPDRVMFSILGKLQERNLAHLARWDESNPETPTSNDKDFDWETWVATVMATLWPGEEALRLTLSPAQQRFRKVVLAIEVTEVRDDQIVWHIPGPDLAEGATRLQEIFTELTAGKPDSANQVNTGRPHGDRTMEGPSEQYAPTHDIADKSIDHDTPMQNESVIPSLQTDSNNVQQKSHVAVAPPAPPTESTVPQAASQFSVAPVRSIFSIQPSQPETRDDQEKPNGTHVQHTERIHIGPNLVQIPGSARRVYSPDIIEKTLTTLRQLDLDFNAVWSQMREAESLIRKTWDEKLGLRSKEIAALALRSRVALLELENPGLPETEETTSMINERIEYLRKAQEDYKNIERVLFDNKLNFELQKRQLERKCDEWVRAFVQDGLLERISG